MPKEFRGVWSGTDNDNIMVRPEGRSCPNSVGDAIMVVTAKGYSVEDEHCTKIIVDNPRRPRLYSMKFVCGEGTSDQTVTVETFKLIGDDKLHVTRE
jgi:hypothetical protein